MSRWLTDLRKKPKYVRDNIAFGSAVGVTALVALLAFFGGQVDLKESEGPGFFSTFIGQFKTEVAAVKEALPEKPAATSTLDFSPLKATDQATSSASSTASTSAAMGSSTASSSPSGARQINIMPMKSTATVSGQTDAMNR